MGYCTQTFPQLQEVDRGSSVGAGMGRGGWMGYDPREEGNEQLKIYSQVMGGRTMGEPRPQAPGTCSTDPSYNA